MLGIALHDPRKNGVSQAYQKLIVWTLKTIRLLVSSGRINCLQIVLFDFLTTTNISATFFIEKQSKRKDFENLSELIGS